MSKDEIHRHVLKEWTDDIEILLKNISEKCQIWRELHIKTHTIFKKKYYRLTIPVIVLSSITGGANLSLGSISTSADNNIINLVIGALGIIISILSTLNNIFSFSKRKDEHYRASNDWYRLHRLIKTELSLERDRRIEVTKFFNMVLHEIERIHEYQPNIRNDVLNNFKKSLRKKGKTISIEMPEIIMLSETVIYKKTIETQNEKIHKMNTIIDIPETDEEISSLSSSNLEIARTSTDLIETPIVTAVNSVNPSPILQKQIRINPKKDNKDKLSFNIQKEIVMDIDKQNTLEKHVVIDIPVVVEKNVDKGNNEIETKINIDNEEKNDKNEDDYEEIKNINKEETDTNWSSNNLGNLLNRVISNVSYNKKN